MKTQDMNLTPDRQGYLGDLINKSVPQLKELLERQEKLLLKRKFLDNLPDKGEKTKSFAAYLKQLMEQKSNDLASVRTLSGIDNTTALANISHIDMLDSSNNIASSFEKMSLGSSLQRSQTDKSHYINSYERVIKQKEVTSLNQKSKFLPHRTLLDDHIPPSPYPHDTRPKKVEREEELSAVKPPCYKHENTKLISVEESVELIQQQRALNEELITQRAAMKLADQLVPKMDIYSPESADMKYRETCETDQDSDDDDPSQDEEY